MNAVESCGSNSPVFLQSDAKSCKTQNAVSKFAPKCNFMAFGTINVDMPIFVREEFLGKHSFILGDSKGSVTSEQFSSFLEKAYEDQDIYQEELKNVDIERGENPEAKSIIEHLNKEKKQMNLGGSACNALKALARLSEGSASTSFFGKVGTDASSVPFRELASKLQIDLSRAVVSSAPVNQVAALITPGGARSFFVCPSLSTDLTSDMLTKDLFKDVRQVHFEGYAIREFAPSFIKRAMELAKESGVTISYDLGAINVVKEHYGDILNLLEHVDILFANKDEVKAFCKASGKGTSSFLRYCPLTVILQGADGALISSNKGNDRVLSPANKVKLIDETGAGDFFAAGFFYGHLKGCTPEVCGWIGNLLGGEVIQHVGAEIPEDRWPSLIQQIEERLTQEELKSVG